MEEMSTDYTVSQDVNFQLYSAECCSKRTPPFCMRTSTHLKRKLRGGERDAVCQTAGV